MAQSKRPSGENTTKTKNANKKQKAQTLPQSTRISKDSGNGHGHGDSSIGKGSASHRGESASQTMESQETTDKMLQEATRKIPKVQNSIKQKDAWAQNFLQMIRDDGREVGVRGEQEQLRRSNDQKHFQGEFLELLSDANLANSSVAFSPRRSHLYPLASTQLQQIRVLFGTFDELVHCRLEGSSLTEIRAGLEREGDDAKKAISVGRKITQVAINELMSNDSGDAGRIQTFFEHDERIGSGLLGFSGAKLNQDKSVGWGEQARRTRKVVERMYQVADQGD